jgi:hypothetical protein
MKKITLSIILLLGAYGFAQSSPIDFESSGYGALWTWTTFEDVGNPALEIVPNPDPTGINTSTTVAKFTALQAGAPYAGCESFHGAGIGSFTLNASNSTLTIMVWKSVISDFGIKFATPAGASTGEIKVSNTLINQWEKLTFDFSGKIGEPSSTGIDQIIFFPDFQTRSSDDICYFDNINFGTQLPPLGTPLTAAPTPTVPTQNVISMFSNAYTNVGVDTWLTNWSAGSLSNIQILGNDTKKYTNVNFVGIETTGGNVINASAMDHFHVDAWTPNMTLFRIKLVDFGANGIYGGGDDVEHELSFTPAQNAWNSYDIALSDFTALTTKNHIAQLIFSGTPVGTGIVYIDNVYFYTTPLSTINFNESNKLTIFPNPANNYVTICSNQKVSDLVLTNALGEKIDLNGINFENNSASIDLSNISSGIYFIEANMNGTIIKSKLIKR